MKHREERLPVSNRLNFIDGEAKVQFDSNCGETRDRDISPFM